MGLATVLGCCGRHDNDEINALDFENAARSLMGFSSYFGAEEHEAFAQELSDFLYVYHGRKFIRTDSYKVYQIREIVKSYWIRESILDGLDSAEIRKEADHNFETDVVGNVWQGLDQLQVCRRRNGSLFLRRIHE